MIFKLMSSHNDEFTIKHYRINQNIFNKNKEAFPYKLPEELGFALVNCLCFLTFGVVVRRRAVVGRSASGLGLTKCRA